MTYLLQIFLILTLLCSIYSFYGFLICKIEKFSCHVTMLPLIGYILCMVIFQIIEIPMQLSAQTLSTVLYIYIVVMICIALLLILKAKETDKLTFHINKTEVIILALIIGIQMIFQFINMCYGSVIDSGLYIGQISTAVYTDTLKQFSPFTGKQLKYFDWGYLMTAYEMHSAMICKALHIHPLIYVHRILANIEILFANILPYNIALLLWKGNKKKSLITLLFISVINLSTYSRYTWSGFLFLRTAESKSMLAAVILPLLLYFAICISMRQNEKPSWKMLFFAIIMGLGISQSGTFIMPVAVSLYLIPVIIMEKRWKALVPYFICIIPCIIISLYQLAVRYYQ